MPPRSDIAIPGPSGPDMVRGIRLMRRHPPSFLNACSDRFGPLVSFPIPRASVLYVADPTDVRRVLQGNHINYGKRTAQYDALALVTGRGLLASDGDVWRRMRRLLQPAFHHALVAGMVDAIGQPADRLQRRWARLEDETEVDLDQEMLELMLEVVGATLFGGYLSDESSALVDAVMRALHVVVAKSQQPLSPPGWLPTPGNRHLKQSMSQLDAAVSRLVLARRAAPCGDDALSLLLQAHDEGLASDAEVRNEIVTLIVAGHETVAATLTWTWLLVSSNRGIEERLHAEVDALPDAPWEASVLEQLTYTRAVLDECLRLYPPAWVITRRSHDSDVVGGYPIPRNSTLIMSPYLLHRDPASWEAPERFDPDRFMVRGKGSADRPGYLPFGAGPRLCIGRELALLEAPLIVAALARRFIVRPLQPQSVVEDFGVTLRPRHALPVHIIRR